jgi:hypothetical protein
MGYEATTPTIKMMKQVGMVACSFSAVGDMVKYGSRGGSGLPPYDDTLRQLWAVSCDHWAGLAFILVFQFPF